MWLKLNVDLGQFEMKLSAMRDLVSDIGDFHFETRIYTTSLEHTNLDSQPFPCLSSQF